MGQMAQSNEARVRVVAAPGFSLLTTPEIVDVREGNQLNVYGPVPPDGVKLIAPVLPPKHATFVTTVDPDTGDVGCVMLNVWDAVHPLASVTVHVQEPAVNPVTEVVPSPVGLPGVQLYV